MGNLLNEIFERLEFERLIEEGRDPVELLNYKYGETVPTEVIDSIISIDPTKKKSFSQWVLSKYADESDAIEEAIRNGKLKRLFNYFKSHQELQPRALTSVADAVRDFVPDAPIYEKSDGPETYLINTGEYVDSELANDFDIEFKSDEWVVAVPNTYYASCKLGENMKWCTANAYGNGRSFYNDYTRSGPLFVNFDLSGSESRNGKAYPYIRFQFCFERGEFADLHNNRICLDEIGMPEDVIDFYMEKGYDVSDMEDPELRYERYLDERSNWQYRITDGLYLNIEFDEDFEIDEPDSYTYFYLYDDEDDRDPISWDFYFSNPHVDEDEVIVKVTNDWAILKKYHFDDEWFVLVIKDNNSQYHRYGSRLWQVHELKSGYLEMPDDSGIFGITKEQGREYFSFFSTDGENLYKKINAALYDSFHYAGYNDGVHYVEAVDREYHTLFAVKPDEDGIGSDLYCVIRSDIPKGGGNFVAKNGVIEGEYRSYVLDEDSIEDDGDIRKKYDFYEKLDNGKYVVSLDSTNKYGNYDLLFNVLEPESNQLMFNFEFNELVDYTDGIYTLKVDDKCGFFNEDGLMLGHWYDHISTSFKNEGCLFGENNALNIAEVLSIPEKAIVETFKKFHLINTNKHCLLVSTKSDEVIIFDYVEKKNILPQLRNIRMLKSYVEAFVCQTEDSENYILFDFRKLEAIASGMTSIRQLRSTSDFFLTEFNDGKENLFNSKNNKMCLPENVDKVENYREYDPNVVYRNGGLYYVYDWEHGKILSNPQGCKVPITMLGEKCFKCVSENFGIKMADLGYRGETLTLLYWATSDPENNYNYRVYDKKGADGQMPPNEILQLYYEASGNMINQQQNDEAKNVRESFFRTLNRLNEAFRRM